MSRLLVPLALFLGLLASPALAQYGSPSPSPSPSPGPGAVTVVTPCNTIIVDGDDWGPGTTITIDREFDDEDCPGQGNPPDISVTAPPVDEGDEGGVSRVGNGVTVADGVTTVAVGDDGAFSAALVVPADVAPGELAFTISGVDAAGAERREARRFDVTPIASFTSNEEPAAAGSQTMANVAMIALAIIILGLLANQFRLRRLTGRR